MANDDQVPGTNQISETPGLAGGPGPTPPGVTDGTPAPVEGEGEGTAAIPRGAREQKEAGEAAERSAGTREADVRQGAPGPDVEQAERTEDARDEAWARAAHRDPEEPDPS